MLFPTRVRTRYPRELSLVALGGFRANPSRGLNQLTMGFEEIKKWKAKKAEEKAKQAALAESDKQNNNQNTPTVIAPVSQPAYFPPCGLGVTPRRPVRSTSGRRTTPITLVLDTQINQNQNKVVVPTTLVFRPMSTLATNASHPGCRNNLALPSSGGHLAADTPTIPTANPPASAPAAKSPTAEQTTEFTTTAIATQPHNSNEPIIPPQLSLSTDRGPLFERQ